MSSVVHERVRRGRRNLVLAERHDLPDGPSCRAEETPETPPEGTPPPGKIAGGLGGRVSSLRVGGYGGLGGIVLDAGRADPEWGNPRYNTELSGITEKRMFMKIFHHYDTFMSPYLLECANAFLTEFGKFLDDLQLVVGVRQRSIRRRSTSAITPKSALTIQHYQSCN